MARLSSIVVGSKYSNDNQVGKFGAPRGPLNPPFLWDSYSSSSEGVAMDWKTMLAYISGSVDESFSCGTNILWPRIGFFGIRSRVACA